MQSPPYLINNSDERIARSLRWSAVIHGALAFFFLFYDQFLSSPPISLVSTLRVDLVALPDLLKKDLENIPPPLPEATTPEAPAQPETKEKVAEKPTAPDPDEMALKSKKKTETPPIKKKEPTETVTEKPPSKERLKNALNRIKALQRIEGETRPQVVVKGNTLSKGTAVGGDAQEGTEVSYFDLLKQRIQENWALPVWLARQNLSAKVTIFIDGRGALQRMRFDQSSGNAQFDEEVKKAIMASQPYPTPPADLRTRILLRGVSFGFPL